MGKSVVICTRAPLASILQTGIFLLYTLGVALLRPHRFPDSSRGSPDSWLGVVAPRAVGHGPFHHVIFLVLGTIFMGLATPTEAGALGAMGALVLAAMHRG